ncbi:MAG: ribbon-helix-helix domain-containing protein [Deltaproteobacteria bacterium]|nr:ribbon-helix-helix domain-containing protein [Deltaproteobacteria bacterium]
MASNKVVTTIYITRDQEEQLKALSQRTKVPMAEYIRQGISLILKKYEEEIPGQRSLFDEEAVSTLRRDE